MLLIKTKKTKVEVEEIECVVCDNCGDKIYPDNWEYHDILHIEFTGGYASIFGDCSVWAVDLCQHCVDSLLGNVLRHIKDLD